MIICEPRKSINFTKEKGHLFFMKKCIKCDYDKVEIKIIDIYIVYFFQKRKLIIIFMETKVSELNKKLKSNDKKFIFFKNGLQF